MVIKSFYRQHAAGSASLSDHLSLPCVCALKRMRQAQYTL